MADLRNIVTRSALVSALQGAAAAISRVASAISEKITTKALEVTEDASVRNIDVEYCAECGSIISNGSLLSESITAESDIHAGGDVTAGGAVTASDVNADVITADYMEAKGANIGENGLSVAGDVDLDRDLKLQGHITQVHGDSQLGSVTAAGWVHAAGEITATGDITAPNIAQMRQDIDALGGDVSIAGVKLYRAASASNSGLRVALEVRPSLFGALPVLDSACNIRVVATVGRNSVTLGTNAATLTTDAEGRPYVQVKVFDNVSRYFSAVGSASEGTITVSANVSGSYAEVLSADYNLTCVSE